MAEHVTAELVTTEPAPGLAERYAIAGFLAGYTGATQRSYRTDLRIFHDWCTEHDVRVLEAQRSHLELFARARIAKIRPESAAAHGNSSDTIPCSVPVNETWEVFSHVFYRSRPDSSVGRATHS